MPPKITNVVSAEPNIVNNDLQNIKSVNNTKRNFINITPAMLNALDQKISLITKGVFESFEKMNEKEQKILPKLYDLQSLLKTSSELKFENLEIEHKKIVENLEEKGIVVISTNTDGEKFIKKSKVDFEIQKINIASKQVFQKAESDLSLKKMLEQLGYNLKDLDGGVGTMIRNQKPS